MTVTVTTAVGWTITGLNTGGHGENEPERMIISGLGATNTSADLDGVEEAGESDTTTNTGNSSTVTVVYETVARAGDNQFAGITSVTVIPEPSTALLGLLGLAGMAMVRRRA